jgi:hypothetical protein
VTDVDSTFRLVLILLNVAIAVSSAEMIVAWPGLQVFLTRSFLVAGWSPGHNAVLFMFSARLFLAQGVVACLLLHQSFIVMLCGLTAVSLVLNRIRIVGMDGADQMQSIGLLSLCVGALSKNVFINEIVLIFLAFQIVLAYTTAGIAKLLCADWRRGDTLGRILDTFSHGTAGSARFLIRHPFVHRFATYVPIALLATFVFSMALPFPKVFYLYLTATFVFHLGTAVLMGLNNFVLTFPAFYPAVVFAYARIHQIA